MAEYSDAHGPAAAYSAGLAEFHKAYKAMSFYPEGHPLREQILQRSYRALHSLLTDRPVALRISRSGLAVVGCDERVDGSRMVQALARELFAREIQQLTLLPEFSFTDFTAFLSLLSREPQRIIGEGGMANLLLQHEISTVIANEIDIAAVFTRRTVGDASGDAGVAGGAAGTADTVLANLITRGSAADEVAEGVADGGTAAPEQLENLTVTELLAAMADETDDGRYRRLTALLKGKGQVMKLEGSFDGLFPVLLGLLNQNADETRSHVQRQSALAALRELAGGSMTEHLLDHLQDETFTRQETVYLLLHHLAGDTVAALVERSVAADSEPARKNFATALNRIGIAAVPPLVQLLRADAWPVVRAAAAALGDLGSREAAPGLAMVAYHADSRVRSEAIRALAAIGGREATETLINLLRDSAPAIRRQAILWLGISRNDKAVQPLLDLAMARDLLCRSAVLKKEALRALGRIGDRRVLPELSRLVRGWHLLAAGRWQAVQICAVESIGCLGGTEAVAFLRHGANRRGPVGEACRIALQTLDQDKEPGNG